VLSASQFFDGVKFVVVSALCADGVEPQTRPYTNLANNFVNKKKQLCLAAARVAKFACRVIDSGQTGNAAKFRPFEGMWLTTKPSGAVACAKMVNGKFLIPYSFSEGKKLAGHYYDCRVMGKTLYCCFEHFDSAIAGVLFLTVGPNETLKGGRWMNNQVPEIIRKDIFRLSESLPGMQPIVWVRILKKETPEWADKYFREDWPNKHSS